MATLTVTVNPDFPWTVIRAAGTPTGGSAVVRRTDSYGTRAVRSKVLTDAEVTDGWKMTDYEPALGPVTYTWEDGTVQLAATADVSTLHRLPTFSLAHRPETVLRVGTVTRYDGPRESPTVIHNVIDRRLPLATVAPLGGRSGSMDVIVRTWSEVRNLEALLELGRTFHYREADNDGMDVYAVTRAVTPEQNGGLWVVRVDWTEVDAPTMPLTPRPASFASVAEDYDAFPDLPESFTSFAELSSGGAL